jgi:hypothetical protein
LRRSGAAQQEDRKEEGGQSPFRDLATVHDGTPLATDVCISPCDCQERPTASPAAIFGRNRLCTAGLKTAGWKWIPKQSRWEFAHTYIVVILKHIEFQSVKQF